VRVEAGTVAGHVDVRVIDHGPGIRQADRDLVFRPFQRLGDTENHAGVGLGLAVSRGFIEAVGGELDLEDTPGGGCTMVVRLPVAEDPTPTIIDADLDSDVVVPDTGADRGPAGHGTGGRDAEVHP
jgi:two-component system sensor histidine kinase KdpD